MSALAECDIVGQLSSQILTNLSSAASLIPHVMSERLGELCASRGTIGVSAADIAHVDHARTALARFVYTD